MDNKEQFRNVFMFKILHTKYIENILTNIFRVEGNVILNIRFSRVIKRWRKYVTRLILT